MLTIGESGHLTTTIVRLPADTSSHSLCWLLATVAGIESGPTLGNPRPREPNRPSRVFDPSGTPGATYEEYACTSATFMV